MVIMFISEMQQENRKGLHTASSYPKTWYLKGRVKEKTKSIWNWRHFCGQLSWHHTSMFYSGSLTPYKDKRSKKSRRWTCHSFKCHSSQPEVVKANTCWGLELEFYVLQAYIPVVLVSFKTLWGPDKRTKVKKFTGVWSHRHQFLSPDLNYTFVKN